MLKTLKSYVFLKSKHLQTSQMSLSIVKTIKWYYNDMLLHQPYIQVKTKDK